MPDRHGFGSKPKIEGDPSLAAHGPTPEDGSPRPFDAESAPVSAYGRTKLVGELIVRESFLANRAISFRMPVIYGPRDPALLPFFRAVRD